MPDGHNAGNPNARLRRRPEAEFARALDHDVHPTGHAFNVSMNARSVCAVRMRPIPLVTLGVGLVVGLVIALRRERLRADGIEVLNRPIVRP